MKNLKSFQKLYIKRDLQIISSLTLFLLVTKVIFCQNPNAIEVLPSGQCNFGYQVNVSSNLIVGSGSSGQMVTGCYYGEPILYPSSLGFGLVGKSESPFREIWGTDIYNQTLHTLSDKRLKENLRKIESPLDKIMKMEGLKYDFITSASTKSANDALKSKQLLLNKDRLGFIAQDLEKVLPEAVLYRSEEDRYYIDYISIIPVIVEAMKQQQVQIEALKKELCNVSGTKISNSNTFNNESSKSDLLEAEGSPTASLGQNIPNPFTEKSNITMYIPKDIQNATLYIYNLEGIQLKSYIISQRGNTALTIEGKTLKAGMYIYSLIIDGNPLDSKKMILTK
jgi:hypothetical protein